VAPEVEEAVVAIALEQLVWGQLRAANVLAERGIPISAAGVRCVWERHGLETLPKRVRAVEAEVARESHILTEARRAAWEKAKVEKETHGEFERECPGYCGAQDTVYVGTLKGRGRIYQQTFIDTSSKVAFAKLYDRKTSLTAADLLTDQVVPVLEAHEVPLSRLLTDRGTGYCGSPDRHEYERYLAVENIDHTRTKVKSPQPKGRVERFHKTMLTEFSRIPFRQKIYTNLADLQADLDGWLQEYNGARVHPGRWWYGRTPMQTFLDTIPLAKEKLLAA
jgi:transposase InsO family protein